MGRIYTYSFEDTTVTFNYPDLGSYSAYGTGIGTLSVAYTNDITMHDVAADLAVVVSKSAKTNGTVTFEVLQSSDFNSWLKKWANYVKAAPSSKFALATIVIKNTSTGDTYTCSGCTPQKVPDNQFQSQSQNRSWVIMCADIDQS